MEPLGPVGSIPHAVGVLGFGGEFLENDRVIAGLPQVGLQVFASGTDLFGGSGEIWPCTGLGDFSESPGDFLRGSPGDRHRPGGVVGHRQDDAVGHAAGEVDLGGVGGAGRGALIGSFAGGNSQTVVRGGTNEDEREQAAPTGPR